MKMADHIIKNGFVECWLSKLNKRKPMFVEVTSCTATYGNIFFYISVEEYHNYVCEVGFLGKKIHDVDLGENWGHYPVKFRTSDGQWGKLYTTSEREAEAWYTALCQQPEAELEDTKQDDHANKEKIMLDSTESVNKRENLYSYATSPCFQKAHYEDDDTQRHDKDGYLKPLNTTGSIPCVTQSEPGYVDMTGGKALGANQQTGYVDMTGAKSSGANQKMRNNIVPDAFLILGDLTQEEVDLIVQFRKSKQVQDNQN